MLWVVDKKVVRHMVDAGAVLVEVPIRIRFEYCLRDARLVEGTVTREFVYNRPELVRRFPGLEADGLDVDIEHAVDRAIMEHLMFAGYARGNARLFASDEEDAATGAPQSAPEIVMPQHSPKRRRLGERRTGDATED